MLFRSAAPPTRNAAAADGLVNSKSEVSVLSWIWSALFLAVLFYPITWYLSWHFIRRSNEIEADIADTMRRNPAKLHGEGAAPLASEAAARTPHADSSTDGDLR